MSSLPSSLLLLLLFPALLPIFHLEDSLRSPTQRTEELLGETEGSEEEEEEELKGLPSGDCQYESSTRELGYWICERKVLSLRFFFSSAGCLSP